MDYYLSDYNATARLIEEWMKYGKIIVAYDYDDTVFDFHKKGRKYNDIIDLLRLSREIGVFLYVYTACGENQYDDIRAYLATNNIPYDDINKTMDGITFTGKKLYYNILLDDRAGLSSAYSVLFNTVKVMNQHPENIDEAILILESLIEEKRGN